ncbi:MAG: hypothetical protein AAGE01_08800 [Pseudomonadota bacterium]
MRWTCTCLLVGILLAGDAAAQWVIDGEVRARFEALDGDSDSAAAAPIRP